jgi:4-aminobutyrate--pyruvate transaminase
MLNVQERRRAKQFPIAILRLLEVLMKIALNSLQSRDIAYNLHPFTNLVEHKLDGPLVLNRGNGIYLYDDSGKEYLDSGAGLWSVSLGYSEQRLIRAATAQMERLPYAHSFRNISNDVAIELADKLLNMLPVRLSKVFFNCSGSEANDSMVKMVWYYNNALGRPRKKKIIAQMKGYHGVTVAAASLCGLPKNHLDFDLPIANIRHSDCPHYYRYSKPEEGEEEFATRLAENLEGLIQREGPDTIAAFIAEPIQGAGGVIVPPKTYFSKIQAILKKYAVLFVADEVICGFGRTGNMFGSETFSLTPDIVTVAKALSSSYQPISATIISEDIYQAFVKQSEKIGIFAHGFTNTAHPVCAAVALETLRIYEERNILDHVRTIVPHFQGGLRKFVGHPLVGEVRGIGLIGAVELVKNKGTREAFDAKTGVGAKLQKYAQSNGMIVRAIGDTIAFSPPLTITQAQISEMLSRFESALGALSQSLRSD